MGLISFARGVPAPECLAVDELADCARAAIERDGHAVLSYGPGGGYGPLREWIAARHGVEPSRVVVTSGSLQGFVFLAEQLIRPGARVLVAAPRSSGYRWTMTGSGSRPSSGHWQRERSPRSSTRSRRSRTRAAALFPR